MFTGVSAAFAVKLFKSWINERDINSVAASLRKVGMDNRLMVNHLHELPFKLKVLWNVSEVFGYQKLFIKSRCVTVKVVKAQ